jgi:hypothetical protein
MQVDRGIEELSVSGAEEPHGGFRQTGALRVAICKSAFPSILVGKGTIQTAVPV